MNMTTQMTTQTTPHIPVLFEETLAALQIDTLPHGRFIDGTLGAGGHTAAILDRAPASRVIGFDLDPRSLETARPRLGQFGDRVMLLHASYERMTALAPQHGIGVGEADGVLLDLGVSSMHMDEAHRGFAFRQEGTLDMRFDPSGDTLTAAQIVNTWDADALADLIFEYGEDRDSRRIARAIVAARPITTTTGLADVILNAHRGARDKIHPATRTFQALRIAVNDELGAVERVLPKAIDMLKPGGRLAVITFHSLEDRIVKDYFRIESTDCICPPKQPVCTCGHVASVDLIGRKPIAPSDEEVIRNPRARSAKLRVIEKR